MLLKCENEHPWISNERKTYLARAMMTVSNMPEVLNMPEDTQAQRLRKYFALKAAQNPRRAKTTT